jgi:hypothetical protein
MLPDKEQEMTRIKMYTFTAELQFAKPLGAEGFLQPKKEFNIVHCFGQWINRTRMVDASFVLLPYKSGSTSNQIMDENQLPKDDGEAINTYYSNHRIDNNGICKSMVKFQVTAPWFHLKDPKKPYFPWLYANRIYLKHTNLESNTIVLIGFLHGMQPDVTRISELTAEVRE